jgi:hypothetical protein
MAEIDLTVEGDHAVGTVSRKGTELIRIEGTVDTGEATPPALFDRRFVNLFGSIVTGMSTIEIAPSGEHFHECRRGDGKVMLGTSDRDALGALSPTTGATVRLATMDFAGGASAITPPRVIGPVDESWAYGRFFARIL